MQTLTNPPLMPRRVVLMRPVTPRAQPGVRVDAYLPASRPGRMDGAIAAGGGVGGLAALGSWLRTLWARLTGGASSASRTTENEAFVKLQYRQLLGREADPGGLAGYLDAMRRGLSREELVARLMASPEYQARLAAGPPPAPGPGVSGDAIDLRQVVFAKGENIAAWPVTDTLRGVTLDRGRGQITVDHTKAGQWPVHPFFDDPTATVEGNIWFFANIQGKWYGGAGEWLRPGQTTKQVDLERTGPDQFYDTEPLKSWVPRSGELVGFAVSTPARAGQWGQAERSNVIMVRWP